MFQLSVPASSRIFCSGFLPFRVRFNCVRRFFFKEPLAPSHEGPGSYRRWRAFHAEPPANVNTYAAGRIALFGVHRGEAGPFNRPRDGDPPGSITSATPEKHATSRQKKLSSAKKLNACAASTSMCISFLAFGEKARIPRYVQTARLPVNDYYQDSEGLFEHEASDPE